jgi:hypothetical protein
MKQDGDFRLWHDRMRKIRALFAWLISHQPTVLFSQNKPATSNQPEPASSTLLSEQTSHQPPANRTGCRSEFYISMSFVQIAKKAFWLAFKLRVVP